MKKTRRNNALLESLEGARRRVRHHPRRESNREEVMKVIMGTATE